MLSFNDPSIHRGVECGLFDPFRRRFRWLCLRIFLAYSFFNHHVESFQALHLFQGAGSTTIRRNRLLYSSSSSSSSIRGDMTLTDNAPSWKVLHQRVLSTPTGARLHKEKSERAKGLGPPHTDSLLRLFPGVQNESHEAASKTNARVTLYRDHAAWCIYCQKVWLFLELKSIPYAVHKVPLNAYGDKPAWYTRKVDGGKLPAVEIDGKLYTESLDIMHLLEQTFPNHGPCMIPQAKDDDNDDVKKSALRKRFEDLMSLEQELQRDWFSLVFYPVKGEALQSANRTFHDTLARVDTELGVNANGGPWFLGGNAPSMVDLQYITQIERIIPSVLYWKGLAIRDTTFPHLDRWLAAFEELPCYIASQSDYYNHVMIMPSQNGPGYMIPQAKPIAFQICGLSGAAWDLPMDLDHYLEHFPEPSSWRSSNAYNPALEAAFQLVNNHANITRFACRGAGDPGRPAFHAELADPYAETNQYYFNAVDVCLRHVAHALIEGIIGDGSSLVEEAARKDLVGMCGTNELRENWEAYADEDDPSLTYYWNYETGDVTWTPPTQQLDTCLSYLRDRIGVPRDMSATAAIHLRAHLNWAIQQTKK